MAPAELGDYPLLISGDHYQVDVTTPAQGLFEFILELVVVPADGPRQSQHIYAMQDGGHGTDQLDQAMAEHFPGSDRSTVVV